MARSTRRTIAVVATLALVAGAAGVACVIADPPAEIPVAPLTRPEILHEEVVPAAFVLRSWPLEFVIPIDVPDPTSPVEWRAFLDYDPIQRPGFFAHGELDPDPAGVGADAGVRVLTTRLQPPVDMNACHTLEILVALTFDDDHTPDSIGGDNVTWIYTPTGSLADCPIYDAGSFDASAFIDAADSSVGDDGGGE